jgi:hypothetical protein
MTSTQSKTRRRNRALLRRRHAEDAVDVAIYNASKPDLARDSGSLAGVFDKFAKFSPDFVAGGRGDHNQAARDDYRPETLELIKDLIKQPRDGREIGGA